MVQDLSVDLLAFYYSQICLNALNALDSDLIMLLFLYSTATDESNMPVFSSEMASHLEQVVQQAESDNEADYVGGANLDDEVNDDYQSSLALQRKLKQSKRLEPIMVC